MLTCRVTIRPAPFSRGHGAGSPTGVCLRLHTATENENHLFALHIRTGSFPSRISVSKAKIPLRKMNLNPLYIKINYALKRKEKSGLTLAVLPCRARLLLPLPSPMLLAVGPVVPVALPHQRHPHAHVQGPVTCAQAAVAAETSRRGSRRRRHYPQFLFVLFSLCPRMSQTCFPSLFYSNFATAEQQQLRLT